MKKVPILSVLILTLFVLASCNFPGQSSEPAVDIVATQVARMLTEGATEETSPTVTSTPETDGAEPPAENTPTVTVTPTETQSPDDPATSLGSPAWTQDFSGTSSPWDNGTNANATFETKDGALNITATQGINWHSWYVSSPKLKNAYVEATIQLSNCSGADHFGMALRASSDGQQFYFMGFTCDGQWGFFRMAPGVEILQIKAYQSADPLSDGMDNPHRIGVWMDGSDFTFYIDGKVVGTASDSALSNEGYTGFLIAFVNNPGFTVKVDDLKYWNIP